MPTCEICGMEVATVNECECGAKFCDECGDIKRKLCYDCLGWEEEGEGGSEDEESWKENEENWDDEEEDEDDEEDSDKDEKDWAEEELN